MAHNKLKYCILTNSKSAINKKNNFEFSGLYQWLNVFNGELITNLKKIKAGNYDIIHINITPEDIDLIKKTKKVLGQGPESIIVASLDLPVEKWFNNKKFCERIKNNSKHLDFVFATEFSICKQLEKIITNKVFEIAHPADILKLKLELGNTHKKDNIAVPHYKGFSKITELEYFTNHNINQLLFNNNLKKIGIFKFITVIITTYQYFYLKFRIFTHNTIKKYFDKGYKKKINLTICYNEKQWIKELASNKYIYSQDTSNNYGKTSIYAAASGAIVLSNNLSDANRRCYPFNTAKPNNMSEIQMYFNWIRYDESVQKHIIETAKNRIEYYNWDNLRKKILDNLADITQDKKFFHKNVDYKITEPLNYFYRNITLLFGKPVIECSNSEFIVVCLVKNGEEYVEHFIEHYLIMGAKHLFFIDNGSDDNTISLIKQYEKVSIYETKLEHKKYESEIRRTLIEDIGRNKWCMCVDIDEFFDYPFSYSLPISGFLKYLNENKYTAVIAYMLDMFSKKLSFHNDNSGEDIFETCRYFDISNIYKEDYYSFSNSLGIYNRLSDRSIQYYYGGIRGSSFLQNQGKFLLTKHPLLFIDGQIEPISDPHFCNKANVADICCLLRHYKFTPVFKEKVEKSIGSNTYTYFAQKEYEAYYNEVKNKDNLNLYSNTAQQFGCVDDLLSCDFLKVSQNYVDFPYLSTVILSIYINI